MTGSAKPDPLDGLRLNPDEIVRRLTFGGIAAIAISVVLAALPVMGVVFFYSLPIGTLLAGHAHYIFGVLFSAFAAITLPAWYLLTPRSHNYVHWDYVGLFTLCLYAEFGFVTAVVLFLQAGPQGMESAGTMDTLHIVMIAWVLGGLVETFFFFIHVRAVRRSLLTELLTKDTRKDSL